MTMKAVASCSILRLFALETADLLAFMSSTAGDRLELVLTVFADLLRGTGIFSSAVCGCLSKTR
ncbi:MAG TPA: hypothetical protein VGG15_11110, partial [Terriglobales bacterium]